tara:strand:- start:549 stop:722 length:174 start_codon:yes stop_codon:yes gene_type:complete
MIFKITIIKRYKNRYFLKGNVFEVKYYINDLIFYWKPNHIYYIATPILNTFQIKNQV